MTKTLILMRHAKSSWDDPEQSDHDRPLNKRGRLSADALGNWLRSNGHLPDQALVSSAQRTRETFERLQVKPAPTVLSALYHASPDVVFSTLRAATGQKVLVLGHNPGIGECANWLVKAAPAHPRFHDYPTGATLVAQFEIDDWQELDPGTGVAIDFAIPRELTET